MIAAIETGFQDLGSIRARPGEIKYHKVDILPTQARRSLEKRLSINVLEFSGAYAQGNAPSRARRRRDEMAGAIASGRPAQAHDLDHAQLYLHAELQT